MRGLSASVVRHGFVPNRTTPDRHQRANCPRFEKGSDRILAVFVIPQEFFSQSCNIYIYSLYLP